MSRSAGSEPTVLSMSGLGCVLKVFLTVVYVWVICFSICALIQPRNTQILKQQQLNTYSMYQKTHKPDHKTCFYVRHPQTHLVAFTEMFFVNRTNIIAGIQEKSRCYKVPYV